MVRHSPTLPNPSRRVANGDALERASHFVRVEFNDYTPVAQFQGVKKEKRVAGELEEV